MELNTDNNVYKINTNTTYELETLTTPTTVFAPNISDDEKTIKVLEEAINNPQNQMSSVQLNNADITSFDFMVENPTSLRFAIILLTTNPFITPQTSDISINYITEGHYLDVTNKYTIKLKSLNIVSITPPDDN